MIKIFTLDKTLYLTDKKNFLFAEKNFVFIETDSQFDILHFFINFTNNPQLKSAVLYNPDLEKLFTLFKISFKLVEAAGGLVMNSKNEYLFILRNGKWDLPKGKIEKKEKTADAAIREVEEECGISNLQLIKPLITTYHTYFLEEQPVLKPTYWYLMQTNYDKTLTPQQEEGITEAKWIAKKDFGMVLKNTYESIKDVLQKISES